LLLRHSPHLLVSLCLLGGSLSGCGRTVATTQPALTATPAVALQGGPFEDVTARAKISFRHTNGAAYRYPLLQTTGGGCAFLDYDSDGYQDVLFLSCGEFGNQTTPNVGLYRNYGDGTFTDATAGSGMSQPLGYAQAVAVGDYDNDGYPDVFIAGYGGCHLFRNRGAVDSASQFEEVTAAAGVGDTEQGARWASGAAWGDYDNDGKLDLFVIHYAVWSPKIDKKCVRQDGTETLCSPAVYEGDRPRLYRNEGGGRFKDITAQAGLGRYRGRGFAVAWLDYDGDGRQDIFVANDREPNFLFRNGGNGTFEDQAVSAGVAYGAEGTSISGMGVAVGDYDGSGRESLFVSALNGETFPLFHNEGGALFSFATDRVGLRMPTISTSAWGLAFLDYDNDGRPDIVTGNGHVNPEVDKDVPGVRYEERMSLFRNKGARKFEDISASVGAFARRRSTRGLAVGDYDNDGRPDVLCVNRNAEAELFRNTNPEKNHWVMLRLVGVKSNRDGAGAKVLVTSGSQRRYAECRLSSSYASSPDKRLHFGLGDKSKVDRVEIRWPSGQKDVYSQLAADRIYVVTEGKNCVSGH
jgi:enediyne biosynthesis protein E4